MTNRAILVPVDVAEPMAVRRTVVKSKWAFALFGSILIVAAPPASAATADAGAAGADELRLAKDWNGAAVALYGPRLV
jgi:hypothetical protein